MRTIYIADDGKEFNDVYACKHYEWTLNHPGLNDVVFYNKNNTKMDGDKFSENTYGSVMKIIIPNEDATKALQDLGRYTGFTCYEWIDKPGEWIWNDEVYRFKFKE